MVRTFVTAVLGLFLLAACSGDDDSNTSPTTTTTTTMPSTRSAAPSATDVPPATIAVGDAVDFPDDIALIVETGCWNCDGPAGGFVRVYRRPDGSIAQDILFRPEQLNLPPDDDGQPPYILGFAMLPDASEMAVAVCVTKYCGGLGPAQEGAAAKLYRSTDGGVSWAESGDWPIDHWLTGLVADGVLAGRQTNAPDNPDDPATTWPPQPEYEFILLPEGRVVTPPAAAAPTEGVLVTDFGDVWWNAGEGRFIDAQGRPVLELPPGSRLLGAHGDPKAGLVADWWSDIETNARHYLSRYEGGVPLAGTEPVTFDATLLQAAGYFDAKSGTLYGNIEASLAGIALPTPFNYGLVPALIDLDTHTAHAVISPFIDGTSILPNVRNRIVAVQRGPFARVTGTGSCLNLRGSPSASAEILTCAADGVLLRDTGRTADVDGRTWLEVDHPQLSAWAATDFLER